MKENHIFWWTGRVQIKKTQIYEDLNFWLNGRAQKKELKDYTKYFPRM